MPKKDFVLVPSGLVITIYKRKTSRHLRLSVASSGQIKVSIPSWAPYRAGLEFAASREEWLIAQSRIRRPLNLRNGQAVGKAHHIVFLASDDELKPRGRVLNSMVRISYPNHLSIESHEVQAVAEKTCIRALRLQAEKLLPQRLAILAKKHGCVYKKIDIKLLKGRWGSCDQDHNIVLNLFLMQLPWELIDYVLLHELTHTQILKHGPTFWAALAEKSANVKQLRASIKQHSPTINA